jgi:hypothetical protein
LIVAAGIDRANMIFGDGFEASEQKPRARGHEHIPGIAYLGSPQLAARLHSHSFVIFVLDEILPSSFSSINASAP